MKQLRILPALLVLLFCLAGCRADPGVPGTPSAAHDSTAAAPTVETAASLPDPAGEQAEDFSVTLTDGSVFTLSEALQDHELVLVNLFATWCPPCKMEFPYLQQALAERSDRVAVVALSIEPSDNAAVLRKFAEDLSLTLPMGRAEGTGMDRYVPGSIPTTVLIDRTGRVAAVEVGAKLSKQDFLDLFDGYTGSGYNPGLCTYTVLAYDSDYRPVEGVTVNFCTDTACTPVTTNARGEAVFTGPPARYHVQTVLCPEGLRPAGSGAFYTELYGQTFHLPLQEAKQ